MYQFDLLGLQMQTLTNLSPCVFQLSLASDQVKMMESIKENKNQITRTSTVSQKRLI